ncbi:MAG: phosphoenolpyruvate carboxykinase (ATP) [Alicyclobacillus sp.]|nr:phosphoenolpyruvate carboxykinase (ATP) [Alicyclobacillus sp.]
MQGVNHVTLYAKRLSPAELIEVSLQRREAVLLSNGALCARTGKYTGRSPQDKYFVDYDGCPLPRSQHRWLTETQFDRLFAKVRQHLTDRGAYVFDGAVNQDPRYRVPVRFYTEFAWHNLFVQQLFLPGDSSHAPRYTVYAAPTLHADPASDGTRSETFIALHLRRGIVLIGGTEYAGELKKSIFTLMHHELAGRGVMPMHCSATVGEEGDVALFFGLSGTGKTTLSADPERRLIGDDEHGWSEHGVFNLENGCYAKCLDLSRDREPDIWDAIRFGAVLENVTYDRRRNPVYSDASLTQNTRAAYPLSFIRNAEPTGQAGHPKAIVFLSADATGVLPAIARLTPEDARKHFLLGYTSKLAGTERGVAQPEPTFSPCFGAPFLTDVPTRYADMLMERIARHRVRVYLVNTGWVGGGVHRAPRIPLSLTRDLVRRAIRGELDRLPACRDEELSLNIPSTVPGIPPEYLQPECGFPDAESYRQARMALVQSFAKQLNRFQPQPAPSLRAL